MPYDAPDDPLVGTTLNGDYEIEALIGRGGMGSIYRARDIRLKRPCALKMLHPHLAGDPEYASRFLREAQTIAQLQHPNIVDIYSYGRDAAGRPFFAMELLGGEDLDNRITRRAERPYSTRDACLWAVEIARAVAEVHNVGIIHRDLKASNIFLKRGKDGTDQVKLLDFGIAKPTHAGGQELTKEGISLGTPNYMSPEQIRSSALDQRTDIYSFGVLVFKLLTGKLPFVGDPLEVANAHCGAEVPTPSVAAPGHGITPGLDRLVKQAMAKQPQDRPESMLVLERALLRELALMSTPASPTADHATLELRVDPGREPTLAMPTGNRRTTYALLGLSVLSTVGLVALLVVWLRGAPDAPVRPTTAGPPRLEEPARSAHSSPPPEAPTSPADPPLQISPPPAQPVAPPVMSSALVGDPLPVTDERPVDTPSTERAPQPRRTPPPAAKKPLDPLPEIKARAAACRRLHDAVGGPAITVEYAIRSDGGVLRAVAGENSELGRCLARAVSQARFKPGMRLGQKIRL